MNWTIIIIETIVLTLAFTAMILIPLVKKPVWWIADYPEDIQEVMGLNSTNHKNRKKIIHLFLVLRSSSWRYSILGTVALRRYSPYTVTTWTFIIAAIGSILISHPADIVENRWWPR